MVLERRECLGYMLPLLVLRPLLMNCVVLRDILALR